MALKDVTWRLVYDRLWLRFKVEEIRFKVLDELLSLRRRSPHRGSRRGFRWLDSSF